MRDEVVQLARDLRALALRGGNAGAQHTGLLGSRSEEPAGPPGECEHDGRPDEVRESSRREVDDRGSSSDDSETGVRQPARTELPEGSGGEQRREERHGELHRVVAGHEREQHECSGDRHRDGERVAVPEDERHRPPQRDHGNCRPMIDRVLDEHLDDGRDREREHEPLQGMSPNSSAEVVHCRQRNRMFTGIASSGVSNVSSSPRTTCEPASLGSGSYAGRRFGRNRLRQRPDRRGRGAAASAPLPLRVPSRRGRPCDGGRGAHARVGDAAVRTGCDAAGAGPGARRDPGLRRDPSPPSGACGDPDAAGSPRRRDGRLVSGLPGAALVRARADEGRHPLRRRGRPRRVRGAGDVDDLEVRSPPPAVRRREGRRPLQPARAVVRTS